MTESMTMVRVGSRDYPRKSVHDCVTCQSDHRLFIENELMLGRPYAVIAREIAEMDHGRFGVPSARSLSTHAKSHLIAPQSVTRRIMDDRAEELGSKIDGSESLIDYHVISKAMLAVGWDKFVSGEINMSASDLLAVMNFQHKLDTTSDSGYDVNVMEQALTVYMDVVATFLSREELREVGKILSKHPVLRAIFGKSESGKSVREEQQQGPLAIEAPSA